jgi:hypothetical protein
MKMNKQSIDFIAMWEKAFHNGGMPLQVLAQHIYYDFIENGWFSPDSKEPNKEGISFEAMKKLEKLIAGSGPISDIVPLYDIAFMYNIYKDGDMPYIRTYNNWKREIYKWAEANGVWIASSY